MTEKNGQCKVFILHAWKEWGTKRSVYTFNWLFFPVSGPTNGVIFPLYVPDVEVAIQWAERILGSGNYEVEETEKAIVVTRFYRPEEVPTCALELQTGKRNHILRVLARGFPRKVSYLDILTVYKGRMSETLRCLRGDTFKED